MVYGHTAQEVKSSRKFFERTGRYLGQDIVEREASSPRVVAQNESFLACVPWFALCLRSVYSAQATDVFAARLGSPRVHGIRFHAL
jgi:galactose-1-phosphate uridylyltransferase